MIESKFSKNVVPLLIVAGIAVAAALGVMGTAHDPKPDSKGPHPEPVSDAKGSPSGKPASADAGLAPPPPSKIAAPQAARSPTSAVQAPETVPDTTASTQATPSPAMVQRLHSGWERLAQVLDQRDHSPLSEANGKDLDQLIQELEKNRESFTVWFQILLDQHLEKIIKAANESM